MTRTPRVPPQSLEAEQATLGAMLLERAAIDKAGELLRPEDFIREAHKLIFIAATDLVGRNEPVDLTTLAAELGNRSQLEPAGGRPYLASLLDAVPTAGHVEYYARIVRQKSKLRRAISAATEISEECYGDVEDADEVIRRGQAAMYAIATDTDSTTRSAKALVDMAMDYIDARHAAPSVVSGVPTGLTRLDELTNGLDPGLIVVAGESGTGKTAFALNLMLSACDEWRRKGSTKRALFFSLEMSDLQIGLRLVQMQARVNSHRLRSGFWADGDEVRLMEAYKRLWEMPFDVEFMRPVTPSRLMARCRQVEDLGLVLFDYSQMGEADKPTGEAWMDIRHMMQGFKDAAAHLRVPLVALSQLNAADNKSGKGRPSLDRLLGGGGIRNPADTAILLWRDTEREKELQGADRWGERPDGVTRPMETRIVKVHLAKQRGGMEGEFESAFLADWAKFEDLAEEGRA